MFSRWLRTLFLRVEIDGVSMMPTLGPGQRVTASRRWRPLREGDVVVTSDPRKPERFLVKRCVRREGSLWELRGDNEEYSTDSRSFGLVPARELRWVISPRSLRNLR